MPVVGILALVQVRVGTHASARAGIQSNFSYMLAVVAAISLSVFVQTLYLTLAILLK